MISPTGVNQLANKIAEQGLQEGPKESTGKQPEANANDQAHFQDALKNNPQNNPEASPAVASAQTTPPVDGMQPQKPLTMGDSILKGIDKMRTDQQDVGNQLKGVDGMENMSPQELLKTQMQVSRVMFNEQLTGQVTGKVEQDMDSLLKSQ